MADQSLHAIRRFRARRRLRGLTPRSVLFVCQGNVCRSPFAAALFEREWRRVAGIPIDVRSAGFQGTGRPAPPKAIAAAASRDIDLSGHSSALLRPYMVSAATLIVAMSVEQARAVRRSGVHTRDPIVLGDLDPEPITKRTILDPWAKTDAAFEESYSRIERCVRELVQTVAPHQ